jgi:hypothetical protein
MPSGNGVADFWGIYPINSTEKATPGKEVLYSFTPSSTAVYYLDVSSVGSELSYFYKPVSAGCGNSGWTGIANISSTGKFPIGLLQASTPYYILIDNPSTFATAHTFKICKAAVSGSVFTNTCVAGISTNFIPANNPTPEYLIDDGGNLFAALDFSNTPNAVGNMTGSYWVNSGAVRHDTAQREYLDRNFTISTVAGTPVTGPVGVTLYFTNAELQRLISQPDDGNADVGAITDLRVTKDQTSCSGYSGTMTSFISPTGTGTYDTSKYIQFNTPGFSTFYLHGGSEQLFNNTILCPGDNTAMSMAPPGDGYIYQWQVNTGAGFVNVIPNEYYSGINSPTLILTYPPTSYYGYKYRCVATGPSTVISDYRTLKFSMTWTGVETRTWEDPRNWTCDVFGKETIPDANVDVIIPNVTKKPVINSNVSCRSVVTKPGATLTVTPGYKLTITGQ